MSKVGCTAGVKQSEESWKTGCLDRFAAAFVEGCIHAPFFSVSEAQRALQMLCFNMNSTSGGV